MIKFISTLPIGDVSTIQGMIDNLEGVQSQSLANQMNEKFKDKFCPLHPDIESIVQINMLASIKMQAVKVCCESFESRIEKGFKDD